MADPRDAPGAADAPAPRPRQLLPILLIAPYVAFCACWIADDDPINTVVTVAMAAGAAALLGLPALFWALDHGRTGLGTLTALGALAGTVPLLLALVSGTLGVGARYGVHALLAVLRHGAPLPAFGAPSWHEFAIDELTSSAIGAASGALYWLLFVRFVRRARRAQS
jgi:hypothetical protein